MKLPLQNQLAILCMYVCNALNRCRVERCTQVARTTCVIVMIVGLDQNLSMPNEKCYMAFKSVHHMNLVRFYSTLVPPVDVWVQYLEY